MEDELEELERRRRRRQKTAKCVKKTAAFLFSHVGLAALVVAYTIMGGFLFQALEAPAENREKVRIVKFKNDKVEELHQLTAHLCLRTIDRQNFTDSVQEILLQFQMQVTLAVKENGWDGNDSTDESVLQWSFAGALLYAVTVITTIGYGHVAPKTAWGRMITIVYALLGIPLTFLYLSNMGNFMAKCFRLFYEKVCCGLCIYRCQGGLCCDADEEDTTTTTTSGSGRRRHSRAVRLVLAAQHNRAFDDSSSARKSDDNLAGRGRNSVGNGGIELETLTKANSTALVADAGAVVDGGGRATGSENDVTEQPTNEEATEARNSSLASSNSSPSSSTPLVGRANVGATVGETVGPLEAETVREINGDGENDVETAADEPAEITCLANGPLNSGSRSEMDTNTGLLVVSATQLEVASAADQTSVGQETSASVAAAGALDNEKSRNYTNEAEKAEEAASTDVVGLLLQATDDRSPNDESFPVSLNTENENELSLIAPSSIGGEFDENSTPTTALGDGVESSDDYLDLIIPAYLFQIPDEQLSAIPVPDDPTSTALSVSCPDADVFPSPISRRRIRLRRFSLRDLPSAEDEANSPERRLRHLAPLTVDRAVGVDDVDAVVENVVDDFCILTDETDRYHVETPHPLQSTSSEDELIRDGQEFQAEVGKETEQLESETKVSRSTVAVGDDDVDDVEDERRRKRTELDDDDTPLYGELVVDLDQLGVFGNQNEPEVKVTVPISICLMIIAAYIVCGSMLFTLWEDWDFLTGSYFCFITLSTIGFGDIVPGTGMKDWASREKLFLCAMWLALGLSMLAMCFSLMQEEVRDKCRWIADRLGIFGGDDEDDA